MKKMSKLLCLPSILSLSISSAMGSTLEVNYHTLKSIFPNLPISESLGLGL